MKTKRLVVVLGMHRSGTSAVTRGLQVMGVELGDRMMLPAEGNNSKGFWEDIDLNALNIQILESICRDWNHLTPIEAKDVEILRNEGYFLRAVELLRQKVNGVAVFGFKDPRVAKLLPFWKEVFNHCKFNVNYVLAIRHPLSVVKSLAKRDGIAEEQSYLLWLGHVVTALMDSTGDKRVLVDYDRLMQSPDCELTRIANCMDLKIDPAKLQNYKIEFLDQELRHTVYELNDLLLDKACPPIVREVYDALLDVASDKVTLDDQALQCKVSRWSDEFERIKSHLMLVDRLFTQKLIATQAVAERDEHIASLNQAVAERDGQISSLNQAVAECCGQITSLNQTVAERDGQISSLDQAVAERDGQITSLDEALSEKGHLLVSILGSNSWRLTKPLRFIFRLLRGNKFAVNQSLVNWWRHNNNYYEILRTQHPILAELRYGLFIRLVNGKVKYNLKRILGHYSYSNGLSSRSVEAPGEFVPTLRAELQPYTSEYQRDEDFSALRTDIKTIAFYLPQFHAIKENNQWWGNGFTEWTNTQKSTPRFFGHYQPREPHDDIGYYDLSDIETMRSQADLARKHGIYGFCFYYYWFSGKRLLETPVDQLLKNPEIDINFCLCWANENWTRTWDGMHRDVLVSQNYFPEDPVNFISGIRRYIDDPRYIRIDGKPVIMVYKPHIIPDVEKVIATWRQWWRDNIGGELEIWCNRTNFSDTGCESLKNSFDAVVEFPPHVVPYEIDQVELDLDTTGHFYDYQRLVSDIVHGAERTKTPSIDFYRTAMLGWDNSARRKDGWSVWYGFTLESYYYWLRHLVAYTRNTFPVDRRFVFINAWNEWAEGTYLEPDRQHGYASINTTSRAIFDLPLHMAPRFLPADSGEDLPAPGSIAVHVHMFFEDLAAEILEYVNRIPYPFDLFITTDTEEKAAGVQQLFQGSGLQKRLEIIVSPNVGRDIGPFLVDIGDKLSGYDYIGHFHGKKSVTVDWGDRWRNYLFENLLGSNEGIHGIFREFEADSKLGLVYPPAYPLISPFADWGGNEVRGQALLHEMGCDAKLPAIPKFPAGNMFWARGIAIKSMLEYCWKYEQFEPEEGQIKQTLAHVIERLWGYCAAGAGYYTQEIMLRKPLTAAPLKHRLAFFVHYEQQNFISDADLFYLKELKNVVSEIVFITNNELSDGECDKLFGIVTEIIKRKNVGFDFGAWRDGIGKVGWSKLATYDELVLVNNSCYGPVFPFAEMFSAMAEKSCDFWSVTGFPLLRCSSRVEAKRLPGNSIPMHLQSYFMVFNKPVLDSHEFRNFWENVEDKLDILEVVANYETQLTGKLASVGFKWDCYVPESFDLQKQNNSVEFNAIYNLPVEMLLLRSPLVKKKVVTYAHDQVALLKCTVSDYGMFPTSLMFSES